MFSKRNHLKRAKKCNYCINVNQSRITMLSYFLISLTIQVDITENVIDIIRLCLVKRKCLPKKYWSQHTSLTITLTIKFYIKLISQVKQCHYGPVSTPFPFKSLFVIVSFRIKWKTFKTLNKFVCHTPIST